jgi:splicing factor 3A subunit 2
MSTWEQKVEPADKRFQYLSIAAEPYESVAFTIQRVGISTGEKESYGLIGTVSAFILYIFEQMLAV